MAGYHIRDIKKGELGTLSKIQEELDEALDAEEQDNPVMILAELSDLIGAVESYLNTRFSGDISLTDLKTMADATQRAFNSGRRTND